MKEQLITLKTARLAKKKGFDLNFAAYNYSEENSYELGLNVYTKEDLLNYKIYPAPTQSLLQKWIREKYDLHIEVYIFEDGKYQGWILSDIFTEIEDDEIYLDTYEDTLEDALQEALKEIK